MKAEVLKGHLDLLLLAAVQDRPAHGYAIAERLRALYPALHRLERAGLLSSRWSEVNGRRRRVYQLTARGHRDLARQGKAWRDFARAVHAVVEGRA
jgi:DNA-binding PadR family transcriptional regulator